MTGKWSKPRPHGIGGAELWRPWDRGLPYVCGLFFHVPGEMINIGVEHLMVTGRTQSMDLSVCCPDEGHQRISASECRMVAANRPMP